MPGTCFGFAVHSPIALEYLREGDGERLDVLPGGAPAAGQLLREWTPQPGKPNLHARLYADGDRYQLWIAGAGGGWFHIDPGAPSVAVPAAGERVRREERLWGIPALLCFRARGDVPLHAAAVEVDGGAVLLAAPSTFGKTTFAAALAGAGHRLLAEDLSCLRMAQEPAVIPGPAMLRVRHDMAAALDLSFARAIAEDADRVHLALDDRGDCEPVPLQAIVLLRESADTVALERVDAATALPELFHLSFRLPGREEQARCFEAVTEVAYRVPVWDLRRPLTVGALPEAVAAVTAL